MEQQPIITTSISQEHRHTWLYIIIALFFSIILILLIVIITTLIKKPTLYQPQPITTLQYQPQNTQSQPSSVQNQIQQVTPLPVQSKQNLQAIAQTLDSISMTQVTASLNQNSQDTSSFSQ